MPKSFLDSLPGELFISVARSASGYTRQPSGKFVPLRLIQGKPAFIRMGASRIKKPKILIVSKSISPHLTYGKGSMDFLSQLSENGFKIYLSLGNDFVPFVAENYQHNYKAFEPIPSARIIADFCQQYECSIDEVFILTPLYLKALIYQCAVEEILEHYEILIESDDYSDGAIVEFAEDGLYIKPDDETYKKDKVKKLYIYDFKVEVRDKFSLPELRELSLNRIDIKDGLARLLSAPKLQILNISFDLEEEELSDLSLKNLTELCFENLNISKINLFKLLSSVPCLERLTLENCFILDRASSQQDVYQEYNLSMAINAAPRLKSLTIDQSSDTDGDWVVFDDKWIPNTRVTNIVFSGDLLTVDVEKLFVAFPNIESLSLHDSYITFSPAAAKLLGGLKKLSLSGFRLDEHADLINLIQASCNLEALFFDDLLDIVGKCALPKTLETLACDWNNDVDKLKRLFDSLPKLKYIAPFKNRQLRAGMDVSVLIEFLTNSDHAAAKIYLKYLRYAINKTIKNQQERSGLFAGSSALDAEVINDVAAGSIHQSLPGEVVKVDASPSKDDDQCRVVNRIFFNREKSRHPPPTDYRLRTFNKITISDEACSASQAFTQVSDGDLELTSVDTVHEVAEDTFKFLPAEDSFFYAKCKLVLTEQWQALPSLSPNEIMHYYHSEPAVPVEIRYSKRDSLYYIRAIGVGKDQIKVTADFTIEVQPEKSIELPEAIKQKIAMYRGFSCKPLVMEKSEPTGKDYLQALITQKTGLCRHRVIAFKSELMEAYPHILCRIVSNGYHAFIEIYYQGSWLKCDLGGKEMRLIINEVHQPQVLAPSEADGREVDSRAADGFVDLLLSDIKPARRLAFFPLVIQQIAGALGSKQQSSQSVISLSNLLRAHAENHLLEVLSDNDLYQTALALQALAQDKGQPVYRIDSPDDLVCSSHFIRRSGTGGRIFPGPGGVLYDFLRRHTDPANPPLILVNYDKFNATDIVRFNQLLDKVRLADGVPIPERAVVIGLINPHKPTSYQGSDFYSRFHRVTKVEPKDLPSVVIPPIRLLNEIAADRRDKKTRIDLFQREHWKNELLGAWHMEKDNLVFVPGPLLQAIKAGETEVVLVNPPADITELKVFIDQANLQHGFMCEGEWIALPRGFQWLFDRGYNFLQWQDQLTIKLDPMPKNDKVKVYVLNSSLLENFFVQSHCDHGSKSLITLPGLLAENQEKTLILYLTSQLAEFEWAKLLSEAQRCKVHLNVHLAPELTLPKALKDVLADDVAMDDEVELMGAAAGGGASFSSSSSAAAAVDFLPAAPSSMIRLDATKDFSTRVIVSDDADLTLRQLHYMSLPQRAVVIDISEMDASDLLVRLDGQFDEVQSRFQFTEQQGVLLRALQAKQNVVLKGRFNQELLDHLAELLINRFRLNGPGKLILLTENKDDFTFLPQEMIFESRLTIAENAAVKRRVLSKQFPVLKAKIAQVKDESLQAVPLVNLQARLRYLCAFPRSRLQTEAAWVGMSDLPASAALVEAIDLTDTAKKTEAFFTARLAAVAKLLLHSPFAFLTGLTGVGKSTFIHEQWVKRFPCCYYGLANLKAWAADRSSEIKTLFIDEANITENDYSQFEGLFNTPRSIVIDGKYYQLTQEHKVIFAGNPLSYGDERRLPSLFARHGGSLLFRPLPPYVLYERVIKPVLKGLALDEMTQQQIAEICLDYQRKINNEAGKIIISPRELTAMLLQAKAYLQSYRGIDPVKVIRYYAYQISQQAIPQSLTTYFAKTFPQPDELLRTRIITGADDFVYTPSRQVVVHMLDDLLAVRNYRQHCMSDGPAVASSSSSSSSSAWAVSQLTSAEMYGGLNGLVLEGEPGIGKSELVIHRLVQLGFSEGCPGQDNRGRNCFYRISASMDLEAKQKLLLQAFNEGNVAVLDEINSSPMMEQLINALLTGRSMDGLRPELPGFLLIGTQNPIYMAGRRKASQALQRRMIQHTLPLYTDAEMMMILRHEGLTVAESSYLISEYHKKIAEALTKNAVPPCFRDLIDLVKRMAPKPAGQDELFDKSSAAAVGASDLSGYSDGLEEASPNPLGSKRHRRQEWLVDSKVPKRGGFFTGAAAGGGADLSLDPDLSDMAVYGYG